MHHHAVWHRDLKPQNILQGSDNIIKIGDFGVSTMTEKEDDDVLTNTQGTYHFMAPEVCSSGIETGYHGKVADIWSLGVTFYSFVYFKVPFITDLILDLFEMIKNDPLEFPKDIEVPEAIKSLISQLMEKDPEKRITME